MADDDDEEEEEEEEEFTINTTCIDFSINY